MNAEKQTARVTKLQKHPSQYYAPQKTRPDRFEKDADVYTECQSATQVMTAEAVNTEADAATVERSDLKNRSVLKMIREKCAAAVHLGAERFTAIMARLRLARLGHSILNGMRRLAGGCKSGFLLIAGRGATFAAVNAKKLIVSGIASVVLVAVSAAVLCSTCSLACRIWLDDKEIGTLPSESVYYELLSDVKEEVLDTAAVDFEPGGELKMGTVLVAKGQYSSPEAVKQRLKSTSDDMVMACTVTIDGKTAFALPTQNEAHELLNDYCAQFAQDGATAVFQSKVEIENNFVPVQIVKSREDALAYLNSDEAPELVVRSELTWETEEPVEYETQRETDDSLYTDQIVVSQEGAPGSVYKKFHSVSINGVEQERKLLEEQQLSEPVTRIERVGTKERPSPNGSGTFAQPVSGVLTSSFGQRWNRAHSGIDIGAATGTEVYAADNGTVVYSQFNDGGYGNLIKIDHGNGYVTYYAHCSELLAKVGDVVAKGDLIAKVGSTGNSTGPHLHFEVRSGDVPQNPLEYLK